MAEGEPDTPGGPRQAMEMPRLGWLLFPALILFWGLNWPIMKIGVAEIPIFTFRSFASMSGGIGLMAIALLGRLDWRVPRAEWRGLLVAAALNITGWNVLMLYGVSQMEAGRASILAYTMPLWATMFGIAVLGERLSRRQTLGLIAGILGMAVLLAGDAQAIGAAPIGAVSVIGAAIFWGAGTVALKHYRFTVATTVLTAWQHLIGAIPIVAMALIYETGEIGPVTIGPVLCVVYNMFVTAIFCYWAWFKIVGMAPIVLSTVCTLLIPVVGVVSGALVLGERPSPDAYIALALVVVAIVAIILPPSRR